MTVVLGSPTPARLMKRGAATPGFPWAAATYIDPTGSIIVPAGALDRWFAYRQTLGALLGDVVGIGNSTLYGSEGAYSPLQRLRDRAISFGFPDGGKGMFAFGESGISYDAPEVNGFVSSTFSGVPDAYDNTDGQYYYDTGDTPNHTLTLQFRSTAFRLWFSARSNAGDFTYNVNGAGAVTVHGNGSAGNRFVHVSGLAANTTHTVVITNLGGKAAVAPVIGAGANGLGTGTVPAGTYYYVATNVFGGGETLPSSVSSVTTGGTRSLGVTIVNDGQDTANVYRSTSPTGPFDLMDDVANSGGAFSTFTDTGSITPDSGTHPPTVGTTNLNTSVKACYIAFAPVNATGFSTQKYATSGDTIFNRLWRGISDSPAWTGPSANNRYQTPLGLTPADQSASSTPPYTGAAKDTSYGADAINPVLALWELGFNDLTNAAEVTMWTEFVKIAAGACYDAGCDCVILSGQLPYNMNWPTYGADRYNAVKDQALASGVVFVDLFYPIAGPSLSYSGGTGNPHLSKAQYQAQADFLWDGLLGVAG